MALSKSKQSYGLMRFVLSASAVFAASVLTGCTGKDSLDSGAGEAAHLYVAALIDDTSARGLANPGGMSAAYWVVDRIEDGVAVLENVETLRTVERPMPDLPDGIEEGTVLTEGIVGDGVLRIDEEETATRAARVVERFGRLKIEGD